MPAFSAQQIKSVLIIRLSSLGDVLLTTPLLRILKAKYPSVKLDYIVKSQYADALRHNPRISKLFTIDRDYAFTGNIVPRLNDYDQIIDLQNNLRSKRLLRNSDVPVAKFSKYSAAKFLAVQLKMKQYLPEDSVPERYIKTIDGLKGDGIGCEFYFPGAPQPAPETGSDLIGLCPGSKHFTKQYPAEYFTELAKKLTHSGFRIAVIGGAEEKETGKEFGKLLPDAEIVCGEDDLFKIGKAMLRCRVIVCNDSGLMHLATALRVPTAVIFGSTIREFGFSPYNAKSVILENNSLSCRPCSHIGRADCPKKHFNCMRELTPDRVFTKISEFTAS